jgi:hypothetical protein
MKKIMKVKNLATTLSLLSTIFVFLVFANFAFMNSMSSNLAQAANLADSDQYRYSNYGSFQDERWLDSPHFTQSKGGEIYYSLDRKLLTDPLYRVCHFVAGGADVCKDVSSSVIPLVGENSEFYTIAGDWANNNIYLSYIDETYSHIAVIKVDASSLTVTKSWKYVPPQAAIFQTAYTEKPFIQNDVLYFAVANLVTQNSAIAEASSAIADGPLDLVYLDLADPNSQIQSMRYLDCPSHVGTCNLVFRSFSIAQSDNEQAVTALLYSDDDTSARKVLITVISNKQIVSSYTVTGIDGVDDDIVNFFFDSSNNLVLANSSNYIHYFNIAGNKTISLIKQLTSPLLDIYSADRDNFGNVYLSGLYTQGSNHQNVYRLKTDGTFVKMETDSKYIDFKLHKLPDGCVYVTTAYAIGRETAPTDLLKACNSDSLDYLDTFGFAQRIQSGVYFVDHKNASGHADTASMPDVYIFSYNPFDTSITTNLNNWARLVYNGEPSPSPSPSPNPTVSPNPNPNPNPYPDTGVNLFSLILLFLILGAGSVSFYILKRQKN